MGNNIEAWEAERNYYAFKHKDVDCIILRHPTLLHLLGYIKVPKDNYYYKQKSECYRLEVHGGITFANALLSAYLVKSYPELKRYEDRSWWIGFGCGYIYDILPLAYNVDTNYRKCMQEFGSIKRPLSDRRVPYPTYKTVGFVKDELVKLVDQILY